MVDVNPGDVIYNSGQVSNIESSLLLALAELNDWRIESAVLEIKSALGVIQGGKVAEVGRVEGLVEDGRA